MAAEQIGDRAPSGGEDGSEHQGEEALADRQDAGAGDRAQQRQSGFG
jgi:hypothetical protein